MRSDKGKEIEEESWEQDIHYIGPGSGWRLERGKDAGKKGAGALGGFYQHDTEPVKVFFKQDPDIVKNMSEFAASRVMSRIAKWSGQADSVARVELARVVTDELGEIDPDENGDQIYVASVLHKNFNPVNVDATIAYNRAFQSTDSSNKKIPSRPKYFGSQGSQNRINTVIANGRYQGFSLLAALSAFVDNPDVHTENFGAVPLQGTEDDFVEYETGHGDEKQTYTFYQHVHAVSLDFGEAWGDRRFGKPRKFDGEFHIKDFFRYYPSFSAPPNYFRNIPDEILQGEEFYLALAAIAAFPKDELWDCIDDTINELGTYYGRKPMLDFADMIGVPALNKDDDKLLVMEKTKNFLFTNLRSRQIHAYKLAKSNLHTDLLNTFIDAPAKEGLKADRKAAISERLEARKKLSPMLFLHTVAIPFLSLYYAFSSVIAEANEWRKTHGFFASRKMSAAEGADELADLSRIKKPRRNKL